MRCARAGLVFFFYLCMFVSFHVYLYNCDYFFQPKFFAFLLPFSLTKVRVEELQVCDIAGAKVFDYLDDSKALSALQPTDTLVAYVMMASLRREG